jgi:hypothetical protein
MNMQNESANYATFTEALVDNVTPTETYTITIRDEGFHVVGQTFEFRVTAVNDRYLVSEYRPD